MAEPTTTGRMNRTLALDCAYCPVPILVGQFYVGHNGAATHLVCAAAVCRSTNGDDR